MQRLVRILAVAAAWTALASVPGAYADVFAPCGRSDGATCATVGVPLDRTGQVRGRVDLAVRRRAATPGPASGAVVYVPGGPGLPAIRNLDTVANYIAPALTTRDLVAFDPRGTGLTDDFADCPTSDPCSAHFGPRRAFYTARDEADDIEAIRVAMGVDKIALFGSSYGGTVVYDYASRYPDHVEWIVLDSPLPPTSWDWRRASTAKAYRRVLLDLCKRTRCRGITAHPLADLATVLRRARGKGIKGRYVRADGTRVKKRIDEFDIVDALDASDENPSLRSLFPAAFHSAAGGDPGPLLHLLSEADTLPLGGEDTGPAVGDYANVAGNCENTPFPWPSGSKPSAKVRQPFVKAGLKSLPASTYRPFDPLTVAFGGVVAECIEWPHSSRQLDLGAAPAPDVRTLLMVGDHDLRAPLEDIDALAARFPHATVLEAEEAGHGVLDQAFSRPCAQGVLQGWLGGNDDSLVCLGSNGFPPFPLAPRSLRRTPPEPGVPAAIARTVRAARLTELDVRAAWVALADSTFQAANYGGGLRGGSFGGPLGKVKLKNVEFVPGVRVSGMDDIEHQVATLKVTGRGAHGVLKLTPGRVSGKLGGKRFSVRVGDLVSSASALRAGARYRRAYTTRPG